MTTIDHQALPLDVAMKNAVGHYLFCCLSEVEEIDLTVLLDPPDHAEVNHDRGLLPVPIGQPRAALSYAEALQPTDLLKRWRVGLPAGAFEVSSADAVDRARESGK